MQKGDLSDRLPPRWLCAFEAVIANVPQDRWQHFRLMMRLGRYKRAVACFEIEPHVSKVLWDLYWRRDYRFDVVTFLGQPFADALERRLDRESLPYGNVRAWQPEELAQHLVYMPDVQYVIHGNPTNHLTYGNKGLLVTDPDALRLF